MSPIIGLDVGGEEESPVPPENRITVVLLVVSRYTDCAISVHDKSE